MEIKHTDFGNLSYMERSCIRNRKGVGRAERVLVSRKNGGRSERAGVERGCIRDTARVQRVLIGDRYALQSERVIFYPIIPDQAIKIGRQWSGVGRLSGVNATLADRGRLLLQIPGPERFGTCICSNDETILS